MCRSGADSHPVFARVAEGVVGTDGSASDGEWLSVGSVCVGVAGGAMGVGAVGAAQLQKRLIYEQALVLYPVLGVHSREDVQIGFATESDEPQPLPDEVFELNVADVAHGAADAAGDVAAAARGLGALVTAPLANTARERKRCEMNCLARCLVLKSHPFPVSCRGLRRTTYPIPSCPTPTPRQYRDPLPLSCTGLRRSCSYAPRWSASSATRYPPASMGGPPRRARNWALERRTGPTRGTSWATTQSRRWRRSSTTHLVSAARDDSTHRVPSSLSAPTSRAWGVQGSGLESEWSVRKFACE